MKLLLDNIRGGMEEDVLRTDFENPALLPIDKWIASSLMQKAIRRGDPASAIRAAMTLHRHDARSLWRRLQIIAFEDIGIADTDCIIETVAACTDKAWRVKLCGEAQVAAYICNRLANAAKDRSSDYLLCTALEHPNFEDGRVHCTAMTLQDRIRFAANESESAVARAVATCFAGGIDWSRERRAGEGDLPMMMEAFAELGVSRNFLAATQQAARSTRDPIVLMLPVLWSLLARSSQAPAVADENLDAPVVVAGIPTYALDKHTRLGKLAAQILISNCPGLRRCLAWDIPDRAWKRVIDMAVFYADGRKLNRKLVWEFGPALDELGTATDMLKAGAPQEHFHTIIETVAAHLSELDQIRADLLADHVREHQRDLFAGDA